MNAPTENPEKALFTTIFYEEPTPERNRITAQMKDCFERIGTDTSNNNSFQPLVKIRRFVLQNFGVHVGEEALLSFLEGFAKRNSFHNTEISLQHFNYREGRTDSSENNKRFNKEKGTVFAQIIIALFWEINNLNKNFIDNSFNKEIDYLAEEIVLDNNQVAEHRKFDFSEHESEVTEAKQAIAKELIPILAVFGNYFVENSKDDDEKLESQKKRNTFGHWLTKYFAEILPENKEEIEDLLEGDLPAEWTKTRNDLQDDVTFRDQTIAALMEIFAETSGKVQKVIAEKDATVEEKDAKIRELETRLAKMQANIESALHFLEKIETMPVGGVFKKMFNVEEVLSSLQKVKVCLVGNTEPQNKES